MQRAKIINQPQLDIEIDGYSKGSKGEWIGEAHWLIERDRVAFTQVWEGGSTFADANRAQID